MSGSPEPPPRMEINWSRPEPRRRRSPLLVLGAVLLAACTLVGVPPAAGPGPSGGNGIPVGEPAGPGVPESGPADEVRALWVVRTTLTHPDSVRAMVRRAHRAGFNTLLVQVRGRGDAYYDSRWEPDAEALSTAPAGYDPLALVLREAHRRGLEVHAWVNAHLVSGVGDLPTDPRHLVRSRPGLLAVPRELARRLYRTDPDDPAYARALLRYARERDGQVEGLYTSPAHPEVKAHLQSVWTDLVERYDVDGLHLDYARYPSRAFDYSRTALERFRVRVRPRLSARRAAELDRAHRSEPLAYPEALPDAWDRFRRTQITDLIRRTYHAVKRRRSDLVVSAAVRADPIDARAHRFQDWTAWLDEGILDVAAPMAYTDEADLFRSWIQEAVDAAGGGRIWAGVGVYRSGFRGALDQIGIARRAGTGGVAVFSYDWAVASGRSDRAERTGVSYLTRLGQRAFGAGAGAGRAR